MEDVEIQLAGNAKKARGRTFVWSGQKEGLSGGAGRFDMTDWAMGEVERKGRLDVRGHDR